MILLQNILAYIVLALAVGYLVYKFLLPKSLSISKKKGAKGCSQEDCNCH